MKGKPSQGCRGEAKRNTGLKREEGVSYAKCSREVKSEKFRDMTIAFGRTEVTNDLDWTVSGAVGWKLHLGRMEERM